MNVNRKIIPEKGANFIIKVLACKYCKDSHEVKNAVKLTYSNKEWHPKPSIKGCTEYKKDIVNYIKNEVN